MFRVVLFSFMLFACSGAAAKDHHGKVIAEEANICLGCHGIETYENVYPTYRVPKLAGQHSDYIVSALKSYLNGERRHPTMHAQASNLSEDGIQTVALFFASYPVPQEQRQEKTVGAPEDIEEKVQMCAACHGKTGYSPAPIYPHLANQYQSYLEKALHSYRDGTRKNAIMAPMVAALSDKDIAQIAAYFSAQTQGLGCINISRLHKN